MVVAVLRSALGPASVVGDIPAPFVVHFDFVDADPALVLSSTRPITGRERYDVKVPGG